jgi:GMP synthase-like glutamine amidotransferase
MPTVVVTHNTGAGGELGHLGTWLNARRFDVQLINRDTTPITVDAADDADLLVMLGSKWSVARPMDRAGDDPHADAAIAAEIELIQRRAAQDQPTLGICFGGQLLCKALGGEVQHLGSMFMDWETPQASIAELAREWFFVHEDHFTLPRHAQTLAEADHATVAFRHGQAAWGLQFHPEVDARILDIWFEDLGMDRAKVNRHIDHVLPRAEVNQAEAHRLFDTIWSRMNAAPQLTCSSAT